MEGATCGPDAGFHDFRRLADAIPVAAAVCDPDGRHLLHNAAYSGWFGASGNLGMTLHELWGEEASAVAVPRLRAAIAGNAQAFRTSLPRSGGQRREVEITCTPEAAGACCVTIRDIGGETAAERAAPGECRPSDAQADAQIEQMRRFSANFPTLFACIDEDFRLLFANRIFEEKLAVPAGTAAGRPILGLFSADDAADIHPCLTKALAGEEQDFETIVTLPCDGPRSLRVRILPPASTQTGGDCPPCMFFLADDVTRLRHLQMEALDAAEREKQRIGGELHDNLCQDLGGIGMLAGALCQRLQREGSAASADAETLAKCLRHVIRQSREIARGLGPLHIEGRGFASAIADLRAMVLDLYHDIDFHLVSRLDGYEPDDSVATQLFIIAREAVLNAARHGRPHGIRLELARTSRRLILIVCDDGEGRPQDLSEGLGIRSMRYRAQVIGGHLSIGTSASGRGVEIRCSVRIDGGGETHP